MPDAQSIQCSGNGCFIVQIQGDGNTVGNGTPYLRLLTASAPLPETDDLLSRFDPWRASVPLTGREDALASLRSWLDREDKPISIRVLTGRGGTGKTRLALELCRKLEGKDWQAGFVSTEEADRFFGQQNLGVWGWQQPVLAVFDYAMARSEQLGKWLKELCRNPGYPGRPLRILLLEREATWEQGWLARLVPEGDARTRVQPLFDLPDPVQPLHPLHEEADRRAVLTHGLELFRCNEELPAPGADPEFDQQLADWKWAGDPLYLLLAACVAAEKGLRAALSLNREDAALHVAGRELERIDKLAGDDGDARAVLRHTAALVTLRQGLERDGLRDVLREEALALGRSPRMSAARMAELLQEALPRPGGGVKAIEPDLIGEAVTLKGMGAGDPDDARKAVVRACGKALQPVVQSLVKLAQDFGETRGEPLAWLDAVSAKDGLTTDELEQVVYAMPESSVRLVAFAAEQTGRLVERLQQEVSLEHSSDDAALARMAGHLNNLGYRLGNLGRHEDTLEPSQKAVGIYLKLVLGNPDVYLPDLALSLNNLGVRLGDLGRHKEAIDHAQVAVYIRRELARRYPDAYLPNLPIFLNNLSNRLSSLGRHEEALLPALEAVDIYRKLAQPTLDTYRSALAHSLNNLGVKLGDLGRHKDAVAPAQEAVVIWRELSERNPDAYRPVLAMSLSNLGNSLGALGRHEEALTPALEAVDIQRELARLAPNAYNHDLAKYLINLGSRLSYLGRHEDAIKYAREAGDIYRKLAERYPDAYLPFRAASLNNLGISLSSLGQIENAIKPAREAVEYYRKLAERYPDAYLPDLAMSLNNLGHHLSSLRQYEDAIKPAREALDCYRKLAQRPPDAYRPHWVGSLNNLGSRLGYLGRHEEALAPAQEAVDTYRQLAAHLPQKFNPQLTISLRNLARTLHALGRKDEARAALDEAGRLTGENGGQPSAQPE